MDPTLAAMFSADIAKSLAAQNTLLLQDHRLLSEVAMGQLLVGLTEGYNTGARVPTTLAMGDAAGAIKAA